MRMKTIAWVAIAVAAICSFGRAEALPTANGAMGSSRPTNRQPSTTNCQLPTALDKWVYMPCHFWGKDPALHSLAFFTNTVARARSVGYNGVLLSCHLDLSHQWPPHLVNQLTKAKAFCDAIGIEVIPMTWDVGYGGDCPGNWFESREIADLPYVRRGGKAVFDPPPVEVRGGPTENLAFNGSDHAKAPMRVYRRFTLRKGVRYVVCARARSTGVPEKDYFQFIGFVPSIPKKTAYYSAPKHAADGEWHDLLFPLEAKTDEEVTLAFGHWGATGRLEIAKFEVRARGICGATRRKGIPFVVKGERSGRIYEEGRDYAEVPPISVRGEGAPLGPYLELDIPPASRIGEGERLLVTAEIPNNFHSSKRDQYAACMSNPDYYARMEKCARRVQEMLKPRKWFFCFDELRSANTCAACRARKLDMAHLIGDCLSRQREIVRAVSPGTVCYVWGDMLDPNHNANEGYAHTLGSYEGIAKCIPQDLVICPWWGKKADVQADYWASNGFRCIAGAYYDDKSHENARAWRAAMDGHPGTFTGWIYATWRYDYSEMESFLREMER